MKVLLDENMPESVRVALRELGYQVDSVASLRLKGLDNGRLYREVAQSYDLFFTKDRNFVGTVRTIDLPASVKVLRVTLAQQSRRRFARMFIEAFQQSDWRAYPNGSEWPRAQ
ncbi:MAG: DUF5615 family PIN-like protein [Candidatus Methylomirabilales bacterium]